MAEILTLEVTLIGGAWAEGPWVRVIEIPDTASLGELHNVIRNSIDFDDDHLFEFYAGRHPRNRKVAFGDPFEPEADQEYEVLLSEACSLKGLKLYYHYDFGDDWLFEIKRKRKRKNIESGVDYPRVIAAEGENPQQYPRYES